MVSRYQFYHVNFFWRLVLWFLTAKLSEIYLVFKIYVCVCFINVATFDRSKECNDNSQSCPHLIKTLYPYKPPFHFPVSHFTSLLTIISDLLISLIPQSSATIVLFRPAHYSSKSCRVHFAGMKYHVWSLELHQRPPTNSKLPQSLW